MAIATGLIGAFAFAPTAKAEASEKKVEYADNLQINPLWPSGNATNLTVAASGTTALEISNRMNYVGTVTTLTANATLSITAATGLKAGSQILLVVKTTSLETVTFTGAGIAAPTFTGVAGKTFSQGFIYNGSKFYPTGTKVQVD